MVCEKKRKKRRTNACVPHSPRFLLRGTILNRTYGAHKNLYISVFLLTVLGPIQYGPPQQKERTRGWRGGEMGIGWVWVRVSFCCCCCFVIFFVVVIVVVAVFFSQCILVQGCMYLQFPRVPLEVQYRCTSEKRPDITHGTSFFGRQYKKMWTRKKKMLSAASFKLNTTTYPYTIDFAQGFPGTCHDNEPKSKPCSPSDVSCNVQRGALQNNTAPHALKT